MVWDWKSKGRTMLLKCCGNCKFFKNEKVSGYGNCDLTKKQKNLGSICMVWRKQKIDETRENK